MKFGLGVMQIDGDVRVLADLARAAEQAGWDGFFIWDRITLENKPPLNVADTQVALAAIALATKRIRFGALMTPLARRRPQKYAREMVSLDRLSNGRLICGATLGGTPEEFEHLGEPADLKVRAAMLDEGLEVVTGLWSGEPFSFSGEHYTIKDAVFLPKPMQQPRIPIWTGGEWPIKAPFHRAARWDGVYPLWGEAGVTDFMPAEEYPKLIDFIQNERQSDAPFDVVHWGISPGDPAQAAEIVQPYANAGVTWWMEAISPWRFGEIAADGSWDTEARRQRIVQGPPKL